jgi:hypothetical protein
MRGPCPAGAAVEADALGGTVTILISQVRMGLKIST